MYRNKSDRRFDIIVNIIYIFVSIAFLAPILLALSISLSDTVAINQYGYTFFPKKVSFEAYKYILENGKDIIHAYMITISSTVCYTVLGTVITGLYAYAVSRADFTYRKFFNYFIFVPTLFSGGLVATYLWYTQIGLFNNFWVLIIPGTISCFNVVIMRTFFQTNVPSSLIESAKLDGAGEYRIFFKIVCPISLPGIATIAMFLTLGKWNDWYTNLIYTPNSNLHSIQYYLQKMMTNIQMITQNSQTSTSVAAANLPTESVRMALCVVAVGPLVLAYPFFQKFFIQGITVGAVKG